MRASELARKGGAAGLAIIAALVLGEPALAENAQADAARRALAKAQALLKQVNAQKAAAEAELAKAQADVAARDRELAKFKGDLKAREAALKGAEGSLAEAKQHGNALDAQLGTTRERLAKTEARLGEVIEKYRAQEHLLEATRAAKAELEAQLAARTRELADANRRNEVLYTTNGELAERYRKKGVLDALLQHEPFTGIKSVQIENAAQEFREQAEDARSPE